MFQIYKVIFVSENVRSVVIFSLFSFGTKTIRIYSHNCTEFQISSYLIGVLNKNYIAFFEISLSGIPFGLNKQAWKVVSGPLFPEIINDVLNKFKTTTEI